MTDDLPELSPGKAALLRSLDHINEIEENTGGQVAYLMVVYGVQTKRDDETETTRGWDGTDHPHFVHAGLLREVATRIEREATEIDDDD